MQRLFTLLAAMTLSLSASPLRAQPAGALGDDFIHLVQQGDTLIDLAQRYTHDVQAWRQLQTLNSIEDPYRLSIGRELRIPLALIPRVAAEARLVHVAGPVRAGNEPAQIGAVLSQGATISTAGGGYAALALEDGTTVTVPPGTELRLEQLAKFSGTELGDTVLQVPQGGMSATVAPTGKGVGRFEVRTPTAVTGVRGTQFRLHNSAVGQAGSVSEGSVRLLPRNGALTVVANGYGSVVRPDGTLAGTWRMLPAPDMAPPARRGGQWATRLAPVAGAAGYAIDVSRDEDGLYPVSSTTVQSADALFPSPGQGEYYVSARAIDGNGVSGHSTARHRIVGMLALTDGRGAPVASGGGGSVQLTEF